MSELVQFSNTAKTLSKNPLGIIALFIILIYGFAALVVGTTEGKETSIQPIIWFMVIFPVCVLGVFSWLVSCHYEKLYAPADYGSAEAFFKIRRDNYDKNRSELKEFDKKMEEKIRAVLESNDIFANVKNNENLREQLEKAAKTITNEIKNSSIITIDIKQFSNTERCYEFPISTFFSLGELTNEVYFLIEKYVRPFEYGYSWVLKNSETGEIIQHARMITGTKPGNPLDDRRTLSEAGILPGMFLEVVKPEKN